MRISFRTTGKQRTHPSPSCRSPWFGQGLLGQGLLGQGLLGQGLLGQGLLEQGLLGQGLKGYWQVLSLSHSTVVGRCWLGMTTRYIW